ncbi:MAG: VTT domain-containing protein [Candidatus Bipolaricaulota bacterium]
MATFGALCLVFLYEFGTAVVLPTPSGIAVLGHAHLPLVGIFLFAVAGKAFGSYLILFLGDRLKDTERFRRTVERHLWMQRALAWSERFVRRFGVVAVFALLSIPGFPDTASLYLFALIGRRPVLFAIASGMATALKMGLLLLGVRGWGLVSA